MNHKLSTFKRSALARIKRRLQAATQLLAAGVLLTSVSGCALFDPITNSVPAERLPPQFFPETKSDLVPVDISLLSIAPPRDYLLSGGDILGVYVEGVLPFNPPNQPPAPPPVNFPDSDSLLPPSIGFPIAVQDDGTLSLPLIEPINVEGLSLEQVRETIREKYIAEDILRPEKARPIVTLIRERTFNVLVVREDTARGGGGETIRGVSDQSATGGLVKLPAYQNDVLHALVETGGLPGLNAKNEVKILRASQADQRMRAQFLEQWRLKQEVSQIDPCSCPPPFPEDPSILKIPLRVKPGVVPNITEDQVRLEEGDIVLIESRDTEVFYTGGLLPGGEFQLPRDYDLDVLSAMAIAGQGLLPSQGRGQGGGRFGGGGLAGFASLPPTRLFILRDDGCNGQIAIEVDLNRALNDPRARPLIQPGDTLILRFKKEEQLINLGLSTFFTFGISELFRN